MNGNSGRTMRLVFLGLMMASLLIITGVGVGWLVTSGTLSPFDFFSNQSRQSPSTETSLGILELAQTTTPRFTPKPTFTPLPSATVSAATPIPTATPTVVVPTPDPAATSEFVWFNVKIAEINMYKGPGEGYELMGRMNQGERLLVTGRTPDGSWWQVCCSEDQPSWVALDANNILVEGDVGTVAVLDFPILLEEAEGAVEVTPGAEETAPLATPEGGANAAPSARASAQGGSLEDRILDPRLDALGVALQPADVAEGEAYWRIVEIRWYDEEEAEEQHAILVDVLDEEGNRLINQPVRIWWDGGGEQLAIENNSADYGASTPMLAAGQFYSLQVDGLPSERVHGMGLGDIERRADTILVSYLVKFQRVLR